MCVCVHVHAGTCVHAQLPEGVLGEYTGDSREEREGKNNINIVSL